MPSPSVSHSYFVIEPSTSREAAPLKVARSPAATGLGVAVNEGIGGRLTGMGNEGRAWSGPAAPRLASAAAPMARRMRLRRRREDVCVAVIGSSFEGVGLTMGSRYERAVFRSHHAATLVVSPSSHSRRRPQTPRTREPAWAWRSRGISADLGRPRTTVARTGTHLARIGAVGRRAADVPGATGGVGPGSRACPWGYTAIGAASATRSASNEERTSGPASTWARPTAPPSSASAGYSAGA